MSTNLLDSVKAMANDGLLGPSYRYADEIKTPKELGIRRDGSVAGIMRAVGGINYYVDTIGFGHSTNFAKSMGLEQRPLGIAYFTKTGLKCSNGEDLHEYVDNVPRDFEKPCAPGDSSCESVKSVIGQRVPEAIQAAVGVPFQGLAPGILGDAIGALNPVPLLKAVGGGYSRCKRVTLPVGDAYGNVKSPISGGAPWITEPTQMINGRPHQSRWVRDTDISQEEYYKEFPKKKEGFASGCDCAAEDNTVRYVAAGVLLAGLVVGAAIALKK
jgi:hypothetical protein